VRFELPLEFAESDEPEHAADRMIDIATAT
jgi:hypothetical protein